MPDAPPRACTRCGLAFTGPSCPQCPDGRRADRHVLDMRRGSARSRGYTRAWDRLRNYHAVHEPLCRHCAARGEVKALDLVDHIIPIRVGGARLDDKNLQSLCFQCHAVKTIEDQRRWPELQPRG